jgi:hypothetical protein
MATAFLTGIVAETARFSNQKTTSTTMSISAKLMAAGANQQLVATQLQPKPEPTPPPPAPPADQAASNPGDEPKPADGSLEIAHDASDESAQEAQKSDEPTEAELEQIHIDREGYLKPLAEATEAKSEDEEKPSGSPFVLNPPVLGGTLTANSRPEDLTPSTDPLSLPPVGGPLLSHDSGPAKAGGNEQEESSRPGLPEPALPQPETPPPAEPFAPQNKPDDGYPDPYIETSESSPQTLAELEQAVDSPHVQDAESAPAEPQPAEPDAAPPPLDEARDAVMQAISSNPTDPLAPVEALNAQPLDLNQSTEKDGELVLPHSQTPEFTMPENLVPDDGLPADTSAPAVSDPTAPPPVPPPMMPPLPGTPSADPYAAGMPPLPGADQPTQPGEDQPSASPQNPFNLPPA